jgi:uncharacterized protein with HEPN domain
MNEFDREWLMDMLEYSNAAMRMLGSADVAALERDEKTFLAVCHAVQTVGKAASKVSPEGRAALAEVQWQQIIGMRHRLVHAYRGRSVEVIVQTVTEDLPVLATVLERALRDAAS